MSSVVEEPAVARVASPRELLGHGLFPAVTVATVGLLAGVPFVLPVGVLPARDFLGYLGAVLFVGAGVIAHRRSPTNATGTLLVGAAAAWVGEILAIATTSVLVTVGLVLTMVTTPVLTHLALAFPEGRLATPARRRLVRASWVVAIGFPVAAAPFVRIWLESPRRSNLVLVRDLPQLAGTIGTAGLLAQATVVVAVVWVMVRRILDATPMLRRVLLPGYLVGWVLGVLGMAAAVASATGPRALHVLLTHLAIPVAWVLLPLGYLLGVYRSTYRTPVRPIVARLGPDTTVADLADRLRQAAADPSLDLVVGPQQGAADPARATTPVTVDGSVIGALVHDPALLESPRRLIGLTEAAAWGLQAIALRDGAGSAEHVADRLAEASNAARLHLERDLHDGAQQQLLIVALQLSLLRDELDGLSGSDAATRLGAAAGSLDAALEDLRSLVRGVPPPLLASGGLGPALRALSERSVTPVEVRVGELPELPASVEATLYFAAAEALANIARHARARSTRLTAESGRDWVRLTVEDDGVGGADPLGSGLVGIRGRAAAVGGTLAVADRADGGTAFVLTVPVAVDG